MRIALLTRAFSPDNEHGIPRNVCELVAGLGKRNHGVEAITGCLEASRSVEKKPQFKINWAQQSRPLSKRPSVYGQLKRSYDIRKTFLALYGKKPLEIVEFPNCRLSGFASAVLCLPGPSPAFKQHVSNMMYRVAYFYWPTRSRNG
jgi:hypothetical protein